MKRSFMKYAAPPLILIITLCLFSFVMGADKIRIGGDNITRGLENTLNALYSEVTALRTLANELRTDHATTRTQDLAQTALLNQLRTARLYGALGNPAFARNSNFDIANANAIAYTNGGTLKTLTATTNFDTGTSKTITGSKWGAAVLSLNSSGTGVVTWATGAGYDSEALAIAALAAPAATDTVLGYVSVQAHASGYTAGTDALNGGTGGNVAAATTYYNSINPNTLLIGAAVSDSPPATLTAPAVTQKLIMGK